MDNLCYISSITARSDNTIFSRSFFYRTVPKWNHIPLAIRELGDPIAFKTQLTQHMWKVIMSNVEENQSGDDKFDSTFDSENNG